MAALTIGLAEAKNNFSKITALANETGKPITVLKNNKPWVVIVPVSSGVGTCSMEDFVVDALENVSYTVMSLDDQEG